MSKTQKHHSVLEGLFGSKTRIKILKFLFRNYPGNFAPRDLSKRIQEPLSDVNSELRNLEKIGLIRKFSKV